MTRRILLALLVALSFVGVAQATNFACTSADCRVNMDIQMP